MKAVVYDFCESRAGKHASEFLKGWSGTLLVDDCAGYKQLIGEQITEVGCWEHARRKFIELHTANQSWSVVDKLKHWLTYNRAKVAEGSVTAKSIDYSLRRWQALIVFVDNAQVHIDNNWVENQMRPIALGRKNWLFAGSHRAGQRAAVVMSLIQSAKLNGHDSHAYLKDVMEKLPTWPNSRIEDLLPHR